MKITRYYPIVTKQDLELPFYVATIGSHEQWAVNRPNGIEDHQLLYTESGVGCAIIDGKEYMLHPGTVLYLPPFAPHDYHPIERPWNACWLTFNGYSLDNFFKFKAGTFMLPEHVSFTNRFEDILALRDEVEWSHKSSILLYSLLLECKECMPIGNVQIYNLRNQLSPVMHYLSTHYTEVIELGKLAEITGVTVGHFCRIFRSYTNMRPFEYITKLRLQKAKTLLIRELDLPVSEVGERVGYRSDSYFIMAFRKSEGVTPLQFRAQNAPAKNITLVSSDPLADDKDPDSECL